MISRPPLEVPFQLLRQLVAAFGAVVMYADAAVLEVVNKDLVGKGLLVDVPPGRPAVGIVVVPAGSTGCRIVRWMALARNDVGPALVGEALTWAVGAGRATEGDREASGEQGADEQHGDDHDRREGRELGEPPLSLSPRPARRPRLRGRQPPFPASGCCSHRLILCYWRIRPVNRS